MAWNVGFVIWPRTARRTMACPMKRSGGSCSSSADDPHFGLIDTYLRQPLWQKEHPHALTPAEWPTFVRWVRDKYEIYDTWIRCMMKSPAPHPRRLGVGGNGPMPRILQSRLAPSSRRRASDASARRQRLWTFPVPQRLAAGDAGHGRKLAGGRRGHLVPRCAGPCAIRSAGAGEVPGTGSARRLDPASGARAVFRDLPRTRGRLSPARRLSHRLLVLGTGRSAVALGPARAVMCRPCGRRRASSPTACARRCRCRSTTSCRACK